MSNSILSCQGLVKSFRTGAVSFEVLRGLDFQIEAGESASIQGESGSGKSTLLNVLAGLETADQGSVLWDGQELAGARSKVITKKRGQMMGIVFQSYYLVPEIDALENVVLAAKISRVRGDVKQKAAELLKRVGLENHLKALPNTLSGGERQRVAIARALIANPKVILADEPTGNLDERTGNDVLELLLSICSEEKLALVLVTHNKEHAARTDVNWHLRDGVLHKD